MPREIWTCDCETDPFKKGRIPKPFIWGIYTGVDFKHFLTVKELIEYLYDKEIIIYAHNGGKFDWHYIIEYIEDYTTLTVINGRLAKFKIGACEFRDSFNIIPVALNKYKKDDIDYDIMEESERNKPENWKVIFEYLKNDCIYLHELVTDFVSEYGINLTQAGSAMNYWAKMQLIKPPETCEEYYNYFKPYYYGGRVECFKSGIIKEPFKVIDINSAYPFAMIHEHPWGEAFNTDTILPKSDEEISRSLIKLRAASTGAFPYREKMGLSFPNDHEIRTFTITGWEYLAARDTSTLGNVEILEVTSFLSTMNFKSYIDYFYDMKKKAKIIGDTAREIFAKLFLNSLYGKFAANPSKYEEFMTIPAYKIEMAEDSDWHLCKLIDNETAVVARPLPETKHRYYNICVGASITGFVRAMLWRAICNSSGVLYCDTDSIATADISNITLSNELGDWKIEADCNHGGIGGKKLYAFHQNNGDWKLASKGVKLSPSEILEIAQGKVIHYEPEVPTFTIKGKIDFRGRDIKLTA